MAVGGVIAGAGLFYLLSKALGGSKPQDQGPPPTPNAPPRTQSTNPNTVDNAVKTGVSLIGAVTGVVGAVKGVVAATGSGAAAAGGGSAAAGGGAEGAKTGAASAAAAGGVATISAVDVVAGASIIGAIIALIVTNMVLTAVDNYNQALTSFFLSQRGTMNAREWFQLFVNSAITTIKSQRGYSNYVLKLPTSVIRNAVLTAVYLQQVGQKATYDALESFWSRSTGSVPLPGQMVPKGGSVAGPDSPWMPWTPKLVVTTDEIKAILNYTLPSYATSIWSCALPDCDYNAIVAPATQGEMNAAAMQLLGDYWQAAVNQQTFGGKANAIAFAVTQLYATAVYPGDVVFTTDVRDMVVPDWSMQPGSFFTSKKQMQDGWWLIDPLSGNRINPAAIKAQWQMVISLKGMQVSPGVFARYGRFGDEAGGIAQNECCGDSAGNVVSCGDPRAATIVGCQSTVYVSPESQAARAAIAAREKAAIKQWKARGTDGSTPASSGGSGWLLFGVGALALVKSGALKAVGFGEFGRRRRRSRSRRSR